MTVLVNGVEIHYTKSGAGAPVILLHGNGESGKIFTELCGLLAPDFTVYAVDTRGHGQSGGEELSYELFAQDLTAFITALNLVKPAVVGFSDGGITALVASARRPQLLGCIICCGANLSPQGLTKGFKRYLKFAQAFFFGQARGRISLMLREPQINPAELNAVKIPVLVLAGERDIVQREHTEAIAAALPNSTVNILKGENHQSYVLKNSALYGHIISFLREHNPARENI